MNFSFKTFLETIKVPPHLPGKWWEDTLTKAIEIEYTHPIKGLIMTSNFYMIADWHNNVTINSDNSVTVIQ